MDQIEYLTKEEMSELSRLGLDTSDAHHHSYHVTEVLHKINCFWKHSNITDIQIRPGYGGSRDVNIDFTLDDKIVTDKVDFNLPIIKIDGSKKKVVKDRSNLNTTIVTINGVGMSNLSVYYSILCMIVANSKELMLDSFATELLF